MSFDVLILGAGWTSTFLIPLCAERSLTCAATTRSGRDSTLKFAFDADSDDLEPYRVLPDASTILITFPVEKAGAATRLVRLYKLSRAKANYPARFIQLGTASIWGDSQKAKDSLAIPNKWYDQHAPYIPDSRSDAEEELLGLSPDTPTTVLNLAGLWGGSRLIRNWVGKVAPTKEALKNKGSLHLIHGLDVSRAILAIHADFPKATGQRWIITDGRIYDWWDLASAYGSDLPISQNERASTKDVNLRSGTDEKERGPQARWVRELMHEQHVRALPRNAEVLGRALDSTEFWSNFGLSPVNARP